MKFNKMFIFALIVLLSFILVWIFIPKNQPELLINFKKIQLPSTPNYYLACPTDYCNVSSQLTSPNYTIPVEKLSIALEKVIKQQPRVRLLKSDKTRRLYSYQQRTPSLGFPDFINIQLIQINDNQSTIAILSQSKYGYSDLGMNEKRVKHWLQLLNRVAYEGY